jgi:AraC-like DNA-binding protein
MFLKGINKALMNIALCPLQTSGTAHIYTLSTLSLVPNLCLMSDPIAKQKAIDRKLESYKSNLSLKNHDFRTSKLDAVAEYIHEHLFQKGLRIQQVLREHDVTKSTFSQRFKHVYGRSPYQYVQFHRMEAARQLFRECEADLFAFAQSLGYEQYRTFARAIKRHFDLCPSACKEKLSAEK